MPGPNPCYRRGVAAASREGWWHNVMCARSGHGRVQKRPVKQAMAIAYSIARRATGQGWSSPHENVPDGGMTVPAAVTTLTHHHDLTPLILELSAYV